jgi:DNA-binding IclR family transcriptional regulator
VIREVVKPGLARLTDRTITDPGQLMAVLEQAKADGYAREVEESTADLSCFAAPVFGPDGQVCAALTLCIPSAEVATERARRLIDTARDTARRISSLLAAGSQPGFSDTPSY